MTFSDVKNLQQADANVLKKFHLLVWEQAAKLFEVCFSIFFISSRLVFFMIINLFKLQNTSQTHGQLRTVPLKIY